MTILEAPAGSPLSWAMPLLDGIAASGAPIDVLTPYSGAALYRLPMSTPADVESAVARSRDAQRAWADRPVRDRGRVLLAFHDLLMRRRTEILDLVQWETGKARKDALEEFLDVCLTIQHYVRVAPGLLRPRRRRGALPLVVGTVEVRHAIGVVGIIAPWNYPLTMAASDAIPALLAGNGVVLKPDAQTSLTAAWVVQLLGEAGLPDGLMSVVTGTGPDVGPALVDAVDFVMFTGSTATGRHIARRCGERLIGCALELGGKNAMIIRADADVRRAAEIAVRGSFANAGQLCISMERIYVHDAIYDAFLAEFLPRVSALRIGSAPGWGYDIGPMITAPQFRRVCEHVADAQSQGARVLAGGRARPDIGPQVFEATVLAQVRESMDLCRQETFGPVAAVSPFVFDDEAIALANDTDYGLNAAIVTRDVRAARDMARRLRSGSVNINEGYAASWGSMAAPMGGMGDSGLGRRHGDEGLLGYTEAQTIATQRVLGFGTPRGLTDERWGGLLVGAIGAMRRLVR